MFTMLARKSGVLSGINGVKARGGFEGDIEWKDEALVKANVRANRDGSFRTYDRGKLCDVTTLKKGESKIFE